MHESQDISNFKYVQSCEKINQNSLPLYIRINNRFLTKCDKGRLSKNVPHYICLMLVFILYCNIVTEKPLHIYLIYAKEKVTAAEC